MNGSQLFIFNCAMKLAEAEIASGKINVRKVHIHEVAHGWVKTVLAIQRAVLIDTDSSAEEQIEPVKSKKKQRLREEQ